MDSLLLSKWAKVMGDEMETQIHSGQEDAVKQSGDTSGLGGRSDPQLCDLGGIKR